MIRTTIDRIETAASRHPRRAVAALAGGCLLSAAVIAAGTVAAATHPGAPVPVAIAPVAIVSGPMASGPNDPDAAVMVRFPDASIRAVQTEYLGCLDDLAAGAPYLWAEDGSLVCAPRHEYGLLAK